ncbi:hypothetical protein ACLOJK_010525 [Asimina triloba]
MAFVKEKSLSGPNLLPCFITGIFASALIVIKLNFTNHRLAGSPFFRDDTRLRALRFLDHMLERDNMQKSEFLKALSDMWKDFDSRVLRYKGMNCPVGAVHGPAAPKSGDAVNFNGREWGLLLTWAEQGHELPLTDILSDKEATIFQTDKSDMLKIGPGVSSQIQSYKTVLNAALAHYSRSNSVQYFIEVLNLLRGCNCNNSHMVPYWHAEVSLAVLMLGIPTVLPPLCAELRNLVMQQMILPMVLTIAESQDKNDFELSTMPALVPVLGSASGETLLLLVKHAELIINKTTQEHLIAHVLPLLVRAYDDTDARIQEEVLRRTVSLAKQLDAQVVKQVILPRVHGLSLKTTIAAVRVNALLCLSDLVHSLDKHSVLDILQTLQRCTAVDRSAPTLMCTLGVANSILKQYGVEFTTEHVLPLLAPLLIAQQLNVQQFAKYMLFVKDILRKIEEKRGVTVTDSGASEVRITSSVTNGLHSEQSVSGAVSSSTKSGASWDEDWGPPKNMQPASSIRPSEPNSFSAERITPISQPIPSTLVQSDSTSKSVPAVDIEWPPPTSSTAFVPQLGDGDKLMDGSKGSPDTTFDDIDPFADWPPRQSNSVGNLVSTQNSSIGLSSHNVTNSGMSRSGQDSLGFAMNNKPIGLSMQSYGNSGLSMTSNQTSLGFSGTNNPIGVSKQYQGTSTSNIINPNGMGSYNSNSIGFAKQNQSIASSSIRNSATSFIASSSIRNSATSFSTDGRAADIGSIFASSKSEHPMPKLAPPPQTAAGRGRGRSQGTSRSSNAKTQSGQPPILDLL